MCPALKPPNFSTTLVGYTKGEEPAPPDLSLFIFSNLAYFELSAEFLRFEARARNVRKCFPTRKQFSLLLYRATGE
ncbi:MAG: hypothetical protein WCC59_04750, partial [Terriglobales bacterium]